MATVRKLQAEIDKTFRKVDEQQEVFQQIFDRLHECDQSLKEKYEVCVYVLSLIFGERIAFNVALLARENRRKRRRGHKEGRIARYRPLSSSCLLCRFTLRRRRRHRLCRVFIREQQQRRHLTVIKPKKQERGLKIARGALLFSLSLFKPFVPLTSLSLSLSLNEIDQT